MITFEGRSECSTTFRDAVGEHPGAEASRGPSADAPLEDQGDLIGTSEIEVVTDHLLEEDATRKGPVQGLGQGELGLEDRDVVAVARSTVGSGEGVRQDAQPLADEAVDLGRAEPGADRVETLRVLAGEKAIVEGLEGDAGPLGLALGPLVAVQADLGVVVGIGPGRRADLSVGWFPRPAPPNRTCDFHRIRLSTGPCHWITRRLPPPAATAKGSLLPGSDSE